MCIVCFLSIVFCNIIIEDGGYNKQSTWLIGIEGSVLYILFLFLNLKLHKENGVHLHNGVLFCRKKQWNPEICRQMDGIGRNHPECGNPLTKRETLNVLSQIWILDIDMGSSILQPHGQ